MEKPENVLRSKITNRQTTFKITIRSDCWCLCIQASIKKKKPRFQHCVWQFGWTATSLFEIWTPAWSSDITSLIYKGIKITIRSDCWCLCIQASIKKKKPRFQHCVWQFGWTATSLFEIWTPAWSSDIISLIYKGIFFFSLQNGTLSFYFGPFFSFFFSFFLPRSFFRSWFFR